MRPRRPTPALGLSLLKFTDRVHEQADQIFVVPAGDVHSSRERVPVVHEAHDVQGDAPDGGEAFRSVQRSIPHSILAHDDVQNPVEAILDPPVVARELQQPLRRNLRAHDVVADGPLRPALQLADGLDPADGLEAGPIMPVLQPADIVRDRRDTRFDAPVPAVNLLTRKHFLLRLGIGEPDLNVLVERSLVALRRQYVISALLHDPRRRLALAVHRVGRRRAPVQIQKLQKRGDRRDLVRLPVDLDLAENESGPGLERLNQMQRGLFLRIHDRAPERLAVDRHLVPRKRLRQRLREVRHGGRQLLRINDVEQVGEGVVARRTALELHEFLQKLLFVLRVARESGARRAARQRRQKGDHQHLDQVMLRGVALAGVLNPLENSAESFHLLPPNTALRCCFDASVPSGGGKENQKF